MKTTALVLLMVISLHAFSQIPTNGLIAYYPFNGNANDESGNGNNGIMNGNLLEATDRFGIEGRAFYFDGESSNIYIDSSFHVLDLGQPEYTICGWFNTADISKFMQEILNSIPHRGIGISIYHREDAPPGTMDYFLGPAYPEGVNWTLEQTGTSNDLLQDQWYFFTMIKSGSLYRFFVNTLPDYEVDVPESSYYQGNIGIAIGSICLWGWTSEFFKGTLDDYRFYNRALNDSEVYALYNEDGWATEANIFNFLNDQLICKNEDVLFVVKTVGIPPISYQWQKGNTDIPGATDSILYIPVAQPDDAGEYRCIVSNSYGSDTSNTATLGIEFSVPNFIQGFENVTTYQVVVYSAALQTGHQYTFMVSGGIIIDGTQNSVTVHWGPVGSGNVRLLEQSEIGCIADTITLDVTINPVGIDEVSNQQPAISSFPNPFSDFTTIEYELESDAEVMLVIYNNIGQEIEVLLNEWQAVGSHEVIWNAEGMPEGIYFYRLTATGQRPTANGNRLTATGQRQTVSGKLVKTR